MCDQPFMEFSLQPYIWSNLRKYVMKYIHWWMFLLQLQDSKYHKFNPHLFLSRQISQKEEKEEEVSVQSDVSEC